MTQQLHKTKGIVLRTVKYGDTSLIVTMLTELFGVQSYLVNGVRTSGKKAGGKANLFQPAAILELIAYHNEMKNLQRIKEFRWAFLYQHNLSDIRKNAIALFIVELLTKCLKQPEANEDLFQFAEDALIHLDASSGTVAANFPLFFALHVAVFFGFRIDDQYSEEKHILDLQEGTFITARPQHPHFLAEKQAEVTAELLRVQQPSELQHLRLNHEFRRNLLLAYEVYYRFHVQDFGTMKTLAVLREVLD